MCYVEQSSIVHITCNLSVNYEMLIQKKYVVQCTEGGDINIQVCTDNGEFKFGMVNTSSPFRK